MVDELIKTGRAKIVDVRSRKEYLEGHLDGSLNIPIWDLSMHLKELKALKQPLILCCASGVRSAQAMRWLNDRGVECYNGGSWLAVKNQVR